MAATPISNIYRSQHNFQRKKENIRHSCKVYNENAKGAAVFSGPDGLGHHHRTKVLNPTFIGDRSKPVECSDNLFYIWRAARASPHPRPKSRMVGEIGWNVIGNMDRRLLGSRQQITVGEFRQACEDRYTHRYQNAWYPAKASPNSDMRHSGDELPDNLRQTRIKQRSANSRPTSTVGSLPRHAFTKRPASPGSSSSASIR
eukprot:gene12804-14117_t